jgi:hypothetical protein
MNTLCLTLIFLVLGMGIGNATFSIVSSTITPDQVSPGEFATIDLVVSNAGTSTVTGLNAEIRATDQITINKNVNIGDLSPGAQITISIPFKVKEDAKTGVYQLELDFFGVGDTYTTSTSVVTSSRGVIHKKVFSTLKIVSEPVLQISLVESEISDLSELNIIITNTKGKAREVYIRILNDDIGFSNKDLIYVNSISEREEISTMIDARNAVDGTQKLKFQIDYQDELSNVYSDEREISVTVRKESGDLVFTQDNSIITGVQQNLVFKVRNDGNTIENLRVNLNDDEVQMYGVSTINAGTILKGETKTITIPVIASSKPGSQTVLMNLKWVEQNQEKESTKIVPVKISSDSEIGVYLDARPTPLTIGEETVISVTISNMGSYPIEATTVNLESEAFELLTIEKEQYIGGLNADDFSSVQYRVMVKGEEKEYPVNLVVKYKDSSGEWKTTTINKIINPINSNVQESNGIEFVILGALVVIGGIYWWYRAKCKARAKRVQ